jgi:MFS family permease
MDPHDTGIPQTAHNLARYARSGALRLKPWLSAPDLNAMESQRDALRTARRRWTWVGLAVAFIVALRVGAVYTTAANWDEFSLFESASKTYETGILRGGGRPGLAQVLVLPLIADCDDEIEVVRRARLLWVFFTLAFLVGVGVLAAQLQPNRDRRLADALLAIGLLALIPAFLEWSIQVRTDHIALAGGVWGGVALLASRRQPLFALAAGVLFCVGFLSSQKLLYVAALMGLLAIGQLEFTRKLRPGREALRAALCAVAFAGSLLAIYSVTARAIEIPQHHAVLSPRVVRGGLSAFEFYRNTIGWSQYRAMLPTLGPHIALLAALAAATVAARRRRETLHHSLKLAWLILMLGAAVGSFHAAAFFYFWMTLGLFPALAFAVARKPIGDLLPDLGRAKSLAVGGFWLALAGPGLIAMIAMLDDTQRVQRDSLEFVHRNFQREDAGFNPESALFCRGEGQPLKHYFSSRIYRNFGVPGSEPNRARLIQEFRDEPILFLVESFRLNQFPVPVRRFWAENYQPYRASVFVAGRQLSGHAGTQSTFELIAPGAYRWLPRSGPQTVVVDGQPLDPGEVMQLEPGEHVAAFSEDVPGGMLVLAVADPPGLAPLSFYKTY